MHVIACEIINDVITLANLLKSNFESYFFPLSNHKLVENKRSYLHNGNSYVRRAVKTRISCLRLFLSKVNFRKKG